MIVRKTAVVTITLTPESTGGYKTGTDHETINYLPTMPKPYLFNRL